MKGVHEAMFDMANWDLLHLHQCSHEWQVIYGKCRSLPHFLTQMFYTKTYECYIWSCCSHAIVISAATRLTNIPLREDTIAGSIKSRGHTGRGGGSFLGRIRIPKVTFIQVQTTDGLCQNRAPTVGVLSPPKVKMREEITGTGGTTRRTSKIVMTINPVWITSMMIVIIVSKTTIVTQVKRRHQEEVVQKKNTKKNMSMIMSRLAKKCSIGSVNPNSLVWRRLHCKEN